jgi:DNA-binding beta-propeller fold protein YncE
VVCHADVLMRHLITPECSFSAVEGEAMKVWMGWRKSLSVALATVVLASWGLFPPVAAAVPTAVSVSVVVDGPGYVVSAEDRPSITQIYCVPDFPEGCLASRFPVGARITLRPLADPQSSFVGWSGDCAGTGVCRLTLDADKTVHATFARTVPPIPFTQLGAWDLAGSPDGALSSPQDVSIDPNTGNVFVADTGNNRIVKLAHDGLFLQAWGGGAPDPWSATSRIAWINWSGMATRSLSR